MRSEHARSKGLIWQLYAPVLMHIDSRVESSISVCSQKASMKNSCKGLTFRQLRKLREVLKAPSLHFDCGIMVMMMMMAGDDCLGKNYDENGGGVNHHRHHHHNFVSVYRAPITWNHTANHTANQVRGFGIIQLIRRICDAVEAL